MGNCNSCGCSCASSLCSSCESSCQSSCDSVSECCDNVVPACPTPFYAQPSVCLESHQKTYVFAQYAAAVKVTNAFNMPACSASAEIKIPGLKAITVGSYLWNPVYGYLQVIAFDLSREIVTVQNNCNTGNAAPGTTIPACTLFAVTDPPAIPGGGSSPTGIFVAIDFTAPNVGTCLLITVTGVTGLAVNKLVGIGSGTYRINAIPDATHIEICNDGDGITPGSAVIAKNGAGEYQYPLVAIDTNPCTNTFITEGAVLACNAGIASPLNGTEAGQVLVLQDPETGVAEYVFLNVPTATCATITCCLTIVAGLTGPYVIPVSDTSEFSVGDILQIGTRTDRFTITSIPDGTTLVGNLDTVPAATVDIPPGTSICLITCCEDLQNQVNVIQTQIDTLNQEVFPAGCASNLVLVDQTQKTAIDVEVLNSTDATVNSGTPLQISPVNALATITNTSDCYNLLVYVILESKFVGDVSGGTDTIGLQFQQVLIVDGGPAVAQSIENHTYNVVGQQDIQIHTPVTFVLIPGQVLNLELYSQVSYIAASGDRSYNIRDWEFHIRGIATT